jgi:hypothetical protein
VVLPPFDTGRTWSKVAEASATSQPQYWQVYSSRKKMLRFDSRMVLLGFWYSLSMITAGTRVCQLAEWTIQSSCHSITSTLFRTRYRMDSCQSTTLNGKRLTGCISAFSNSVLILFQSKNSRSQVFNLSFIIHSDYLQCKQFSYKLYNTAQFLN